MKYLKNQFALALACYTAAWLCVAPSLVLCVCAHDRGQIESRTHATTSCGDGHGHHQHEHALASLDAVAPTESDHSHSPTDHADRPLLEDDIRADQTDQFALAAQPVGILICTSAASDASIHTLHHALPQSHGPPVSVDQSLRSTILLT